MFSLNCKGRLLTITEPIVMGILNVTPDSFYEGSRIKGDEILGRAEQMIKDGATILDIGGQSTRPNSDRISEDEERQRVIAAVEAIHQAYPEQIISIDTYYSKVAKEAIAAGASIVNDVSAGTIDDDLLPTVAALNVPYVLMHMQGTLENMQKNPMYENVTLEVFDKLSFKIQELKKLGIKDVIVDPGFGFGKNAAHNFELLGKLSFLTQLEKPMMVGLSRKATIYKTLQISPEEALNGTTVMHTIALFKGANILRVHDVKEAREAIQLVQAYENAQSKFEP